MDLKVIPGKMTKLEKEANTYGQIHCVDVSTYKEVEWVQEKRRKCTSSFPKQAIEKTETVSRKFIPILHKNDNVLSLSLSVFIQN